MLNKKKRKLGEFNASSMADIAFLLLIFFLMVTTIDTEQGIIRKLPPIPPPDYEPPISENYERNVLRIKVNSRDNLLVEDGYPDISELKEITKKFVLNYGKDKRYSDSPTDAIVSLKGQRGATYDIYIQVQNEVTAAYNEIRNEVALRKYNKVFDECTDAQQKKINKEFPMKISEAEPEL